MTKRTMTVYSQVSFFVRCHKHTNDSEMKQSGIELNTFVCELITIVWHVSQTNHEEVRSAFEWGVRAIF